MTSVTRRILLAEDDRLLTKVASAALRRHGFDVIAAVNGEDALEKAGLESPDLILLDVIMPKLDGFEVLARLKQNPTTAKIPVIMLSNLGQPRDVDEALQAGAAAYCIKSDLRGDDLPLKVGAVLDAQIAK
jgi:CheY-like chemotaxis protein